MLLPLVFLWLLFVGGTVGEVDDEDETEFALHYLQQYHYLPSDNSSNHNTTEAIETFQRFFGLSVTGELDEDTLHVMKKPRCGDPDVGNDGIRVRRYATVGKWSKTSFTYYLSYGDDMTKADQSRIIARAFKYWSDAEPVLKFNRTNNYNKTDFRISFGRRRHRGVPGEKPCPYPFDGLGGVVAHAYYPPEGRVHFDDDEQFTEFGGDVIGWWWSQRRSTGLLYTAVHEIGHALGLGHSDVKEAVMWPLAKFGRPVLHQDDIDGIHSLYGSSPAAD